MSVFKELGKIGYDRGKIAEQVVARVVAEAINQNTCPDWMKEYSTATRGEDKRGIDAWVTTDIGRIPLQIKSSRRGVQSAKDKHPRVPVVRVAIGEEEKTLSRCIDAIGRRRRELLEKRGQ